MTGQELAKEARDRLYQNINYHQVPPEKFDVYEDQLELYGIQIIEKTEVKGHNCFVTLAWINNRVLKIDDLTVVIPSER